MSKLCNTLATTSKMKTTSIMKLKASILKMTSKINANEDNIMFCLYSVSHFDVISFSRMSFFLMCLQLWGWFYLKLVGGLFFLDSLHVWVGLYFWLTYPTPPSLIVWLRLVVTLIIIIMTVFLQDWRDYDYVVFANLNIFPGYSDKQYADTMSKLFR